MQLTSPPNNIDSLSESEWSEDISSTLPDEEMPVKHGDSPAKRLFLFWDSTGQDGVLAPDAPEDLFDSSQMFQHGASKMLSLISSKSDAACATNVRRLSQAVKRWSSDDPNAPNRRRQIVLYQSTPECEAMFDTNMRTDTCAMQAFACGIASKILDAYGFLAQNFEPGDEIFLFGFSRGGYAVRKLTELIEKIGLLERESLGLFFAFWRDLTEGKTPAVPHTTRTCTIKCLGLWDTVSFGEGAPEPLRLTGTMVPSLVENAFHALSIQENRKEFHPTLFTLPREPRLNLKEVWFPGSHSDVGGCSARHDLGDISLFWMVGEIVALDLFNIDQTFFANGPRDDLGTSHRQNTCNRSERQIKPLSHPESRLEAAIITRAAKYHESWKNASNTLAESEHMVTREMLEKEFGELEYAELNKWEIERKEQWKESGDRLILDDDDPRVLFPAFPDRWLTLSEFNSAQDMVYTPFASPPWESKTLVGQVSYEGALYTGQATEDFTTIYILSPDEKRELKIQSGVKVLAGPPGSFAWLRVQGPLTHEKLGGLIPVRGGVDAKGHPVYSARGFCRASDQRVVGGQVKLGSEALLLHEGSIERKRDYNILVYESPLYHFHNAAGEYATKNIWSAVKSGSINSSVISISPTAVAPPSIALAFTEIDMQHNSSDNHNVRAIESIRRFHHDEGFPGSHRHLVNHDPLQRRSLLAQNRHRRSRLSFWGLQMQVGNFGLDRL
ncbi:hypothetical protein R3P38DRAFT_493730 [Favolaschia claudopus]|uniref:T6SS Phospholipase effector Tle1-like catalytic domain-containing protein n=1 Tax=Favolaschia claudopus TaxID=2862362 RepID=A0AAW0CQ50_9AGAR